MPTNTAEGGGKEGSNDLILALLLLPLPLLEHEVDEDAIAAAAEDPFSGRLKVVRLVTDMAAAGISALDDAKAERLLTVAARTGRGGI